MTGAVGLDRAQWRKSSYSGGLENQCVEVADGFPHIVPVRDSKDPGLAIIFPASSWSSFISAVKGGDFHGA
ncbi:DUF397 domain-containing protein [Streptomyces antimycoticus]|uniref:DUF397 domain-containing protein n=1 Tax=Streptomyces antimycoticus TaxID=68175 RepID=UPI0036EF5D4E